MEIEKYLIENKQRILSIIRFLIVSVSVFTIGYVIYKFFFWQPPISPEPFILNLSSPSA